MKIVLNNLSFSYEEKQVLSHCNYVFHEGRITVLLGRNGVGKTTLLNLLAGSEKLNSCKINYGNSNKNQLMPSDYGYMSDDFFFYKSLTVKQNCLLISKLREIDEDIFKQRYRKYMALLMLEEYEEMLLSEISLGTKQRLHLFLTILHNPPIILLDEPTNGLDPEQVVTFKKILHVLKNDGKTIIISTHSLKLAEDIADEMVVLFNKKLIEIKNKSELEKSYLALYESDGQLNF